MELAERRKMYLEKIEQLRLIDDTMFNSCMDGDTDAMAAVLRPIFDDNTLIVTEVITQRSIPNLYGREVRIDALATVRGKIINVEVQRDDRGAIPRRGRYNSSLIDAREIDKGTNFGDLPETYIIFITENDIWKQGQPIYRIHRTFEDTSTIYEDGAHIFYVNGEYRGNDALGNLMHDFFCTNPDDMTCSVLAERMRYYKHTEKGVSDMCKIMDKIRDDGKKEGLEEGYKKASLTHIRSLIESMNLTAEAAMDALKIPKVDQAKYLALL